MSEISKLNLTGTDLDIKDSIARQKLTVVDPSEGEGLITFGVDANGNYGYKKVGADTVTPFKSGGGGDYTFTLNSRTKTITSYVTSSIDFYRTKNSINGETLFSHNFNVVKDNYMLFFFFASNPDILKIRVHYNDGYYESESIGSINIGDIKECIHKIKFTEDKECTGIGIINTSGNYNLYNFTGFIFPLYYIMLT